MRVVEGEGMLKKYFREVKYGKGQIGYKPGDDFLNYVNVFNMHSTKSFSNSELNLKEIFKTQECDLFENKLVYPLVKAHRNEVLLKIFKGSMEKVLKLMKSSKANLTQLIVLKFLYDFVFLQNSELPSELKEEVKDYVDSLKEESWLIYKPAIKKLRMKLLGTLAEPMAVEETKASATFTSKQKPVSYTHLTLPTTPYV
eukprot:TRINITY_DN7931_c0_g7_i1.p1 TRINITY_DN7931_c0_g7~~TRINITY_DN7931_c0_g7_i1.p1  ORF type:complete len:199 (+),score=59.48 TRINITY_DN7931_c0_g7_i1:3-599(+)